MPEQPPPLAHPPPLPPTAKATPGLCSSLLALFFLPRFKCVVSIDGRDTRPPRPPRPRRYFADTSARRFLTLANLVLPLLLLSGLYYAIPTLDTDRTLRSPRPQERAHNFPNVLHYPNDSSSTTLRSYNDSIRLFTIDPIVPRYFCHTRYSELMDPCYSPTVLNPHSITPRFDGFLPLFQTKAAVNDTMREARLYKNPVNQDTVDCDKELHDTPLLLR